MGLVTQVFDERRLAPLEGHLAIGHVRYSTTGTSTWRNAQPVYRSTGDAGFALGHNGNLTNTVELAEELGLDLATIGSDSDVMAELLARAYADEPRSDGRDLEGPLERVLPRLRGAFSLVLMDDARLIGVRDPNGFRPLVLGRLEGGWVLASETAGLDIVGARTRSGRSSRREMIVIDATGVRSQRYAEPDPKLCLFEFVYFARPDSELYGQNVHAARQRMGEELARQAPAKADMVMPVPESGVPAAQGFARESGVPYGDGLVKNRYVGRTFIAAHPAAAGHGCAAQAEPAGREHRREAAGGGRRLDRAGHDDPPDRPDAAGGGGDRGPPADLVAAVPLALLLRDGHRPALRAPGRRHVGGRDPRATSGPTRWPTWSCPGWWPPPGRRRRRSATPA